MPRMNRAVYASVALACAGFLSLSACDAKVDDSKAAAPNDSGLPSAISAAGVIRIGLSPDFPPMEFKDPKTQENTGVDIDLVNALAKEWGIKAQIVESPFDQLLNSVTTGRVDVVVSGISDTVERQKSNDFVDYFNSQGRFYTVPDKASEFSEETDVCGKTVAVSSATDFYDQVEALSEEVCTGAGLPAIKRLSTASGAAAGLQIKQGRVDLAVQASENIAYLNIENPDTYTVVLDPLPGQPYGVVVKKDATELAEAVQKGLETLQSSGQYDEILKKWGVEDASMTPGINTVK